MVNLLPHSGTASAKVVKADQLFFTDGSARLTNTTGTLDLNAPSLVSATALAVKVPAGTFDATGATLDALDIGGSTTVVTLSTPLVSATNTLSTNALESLVPAVDTLTVTASKVVLNADVIVKGSIGVVDTPNMLVNDKVLKLGAIDADGDGVDDASDLTRDGAGITIPGPPANLPGAKTASDYEHALKWRIHGGDFTAGGAAVVTHNKPMWEFMGGGVSIATPDAANRIARFIFAPTFTESLASLGLYYAIGTDAYLVQSFSTATLPI